jgi:hypothetical protein
MAEDITKYILLLLGLPERKKTIRQVIAQVEPTMSLRPEKVTSTFRPRVFS